MNFFRPSRLVFIAQKRCSDIEWFILKNVILVFNCFIVKKANICADSLKLKNCNQKLFYPPNIIMIIILWIVYNFASFSINI